MLVLLFGQINGLRIFSADRSFGTASGSILIAKHNYVYDVIIASQSTLNQRITFGWCRLPENISSTISKFGVPKLKLDLKLPTTLRVPNWDPLRVYTLSFSQYRKKLNLFDEHMQPLGELFLVNRFVRLAAMWNLPIPVVSTGHASLTSQSLLATNGAQFRWVGFKRLSQRQLVTV